MIRSRFHLNSLLFALFFLAVLPAHILTEQNNDGILNWQDDIVGRDDASISITLATATPNNASPPVDVDFIGFAFEEASFPRYVQYDNGSTNRYSLNLIEAIMSRTGGKPIIRLGGTSADYGRYIPDQTKPALPVAKVYNYQDVGGTSIGPSYWDLTSLVPNATYVVQLPMAHTNVSESVLWAKTAADRIGLDKIQAFEPGNEADLYSTDNPPQGPNGPLGPPQYQGTLTNKTYTGNFTEYANATRDALNLQGRWFQAFDTSAHLPPDELATGYIFDVEKNFDLGIDNGSYIKTVASHWYQTDGGTAANLATGLMNHSAIAFRLDLLRNNINYLQQNYPEIPYIISEVGNSLNPTHDYDYQAVLGSALWAVDFSLYAMSIGIARINWQQIMHSGFDLWLPVDSGNVSAQTFSTFYAMPFIADFIGIEGNTKAVQIDIGLDNVVAYAAYVNDWSVRVAIVNLNFWDEGDGERPSVAFNFKVPTSCSQAKVDFLDSDQGAHASADSITYAGSQWTTASVGTEVKGVRNDTLNLNIENGRVEIEVASSSAALVSFPGCVNG